MADYKVTDTELTSIANAIRTKGGTQAQLEFPTGFVSAVQAIPTGGGETESVLFKVDSSVDQSLIIAQDISKWYGPFASTAKMYAKPCDAQGNLIKLNLSQPFEIGITFKVPRSAQTTENNLFGSLKDWYSCPCIGIRTTGIPYLAVSESGSTWNVKHNFSDGYTIPANTSIFCKITYDGEKVTGYINDGENDFTLEENVTPFYNQNYEFAFGNQNLSQYSLDANNGSILFNKTYLKQGDNIIWGYDN